jgi:hypothetical protein
MAVTLDALLGLDPTQGPGAELFAPEKYIERNTFLSTLRGRVEKCSPEGFRWDKETYERSLAPATGRGGHSVAVKQHDRSARLITGVCFRVNSGPLTAALLNAVRQPGGMGGNAMAEIAKIVRGMRMRLKLSKEKLYSMMLKGTVTVNSTVFPDGTVEGVSISWGVTALAVSASWATLATDILGDSTDMNDDIVDASGHVIDRFIYNSTVTKKLRNNTGIKDWASEQPRGSNILDAKADAFYGIGGVREWRQYNGSYKPEGGSVTRFVGDNELIALPEDAESLIVEARFPMDRPNMDGMAHGPIESMIPNEGYGDDADGIDVYAIGRSEPPACMIVAQMHVMPILLLPEAFGYEADVTS